MTDIHALKLFAVCVKECHGPMLMFAATVFTQHTSLAIKAHGPLTISEM
jgi:hypothetical protein